MTFRLFAAFVILHSSFDILPAAPPPELTVLRTQYEKVLAERVTAPFDAAKGDLDTKFTGALDRIADEAKKAGKLEEVLAILDDKKRLTQKLPLPDEDDKTPEPLKKLRAIYREQLQKLEDQRTANHQTILPGYTKKLGELEVTLTKGDRVDEAKEVKGYRERLSIADASPAARPAAEAASTPTPPSGTPSDFRPADDRQAALAAFELAPYVEVEIATATDKVWAKKAADVPEGDIKVKGIKLDSIPEKELKQLDRLGGLQQLRRIVIDHFKGGDADLRFLRSLPALEELNFGYPTCSFTGAPLDALMAPELVKKLGLGSCPIDSKGAKAISRCVNLERINLHHARLKDRDLAHFAGLTKLKTLDLRWTDTTMTGIRLLNGLVELEEFGWQPTPKKGKAEFAEIAAMFPLVKRLRLGDRNDLKSDDYAGAAAFPALEGIYFEQSVAARLAIPSLAMMPKLTYLDGYFWDDVSDADLAPLGSCSSLEHIHIDAARKITGVGLMHLAKVPKLKKLDLSRFKSLTDADVAEFKKARPDVKVNISR